MFQDCHENIHNIVSAFEAGVFPENNEDMFEDSLSALVFEMNSLMESNKISEVLLTDNCFGISSNQHKNHQGKC